ncbi:MAG: hypothetical protein KAH13_02175 [Tenericutes bacterium]|nr:hypothetical protein [Mycoplasmatota bacterium]
MSNNKVKKTVKATQEHEMKAFNPTKSKVGKVIIVILAAGMFIGMLIAAIINMISVLAS